MRLSVHDVAALFAVPDKTVYRWVKEGLPASQIDDQYRFSRAQVLEWATTRNITPAQPVFSGEEQAPPHIAGALATGGIFYDVPGEDKAEVMRAVVQRMALPPDTDRPFLLHILLARESLGSTGIGDGIAIPHVRNPIVLEVPLSVISLCFLRHPIEFGAVDGKPVDTLFTLISPTVRAHLHTLARLSFMLRDGELRKRLRERQTSEQIMARVREMEGTMPE